MNPVPTQSYLLRLWREREAAPLRATLINVAQPQAPPRHFASLAELHAYLGELAGSASDTSDEPRSIRCTPAETDREGAG